MSVILFWGLTINFSFSNELDSLKNLATNAEIPDQKIEYLLQIAEDHLKLSSESLPYLKEALAIAEENKLNFYRIKSSKLLGKVQTFQSNYPEAKNYYFSALEISEQTGDTAEYYDVLYGLALTNYYTDNFDRSKEYYQKCLTYFRQTNDSNMIGWAYNNIGLTKYRLNEYDAAKLSFEISMEIKDKLGQSVTTCISNLGQCHLIAENYDEALKIFRHFISELDTSVKNFNLAAGYVNLGTAFNRKKIADSAIYYHKLGEKISIEKGFKMLVPRAQYAISTDYELKGDYKTALEYYKKFKHSWDSLQSLDHKKLIEELEAKYEKTQMEKQVKFLEQEKAKNDKIIIFQRLALFGGAISIVLLIMLIINQRKNHRERLLSHKKLQEQNSIITKQKTELEKLNRNKDKFFSIVAHDLKNPFNSILGFLSIMIRSKAKLPEEKMLYYLNILNNTASSTYSLLLNLLSWARSQMNTIKFEPRSIQVNQLISDEINFAKNIALHKKISLESSIKEEISCYADEEMLSFILRNLISNAIKYSHEESVIKIDTYQYNSHYRFCVEDSGTGIPKKIGKQLFVNGKNESTPGTKGESGTGLGLVLCKEYVEKQGGNIWFESEENAGTKFFFTLPPA